MLSGIYLLARVACITRVDLWLPISLDFCIGCDDVIKSKQIYSLLMMPEIRPKHVNTVTSHHVKTTF